MTPSEMELSKHIISKCGGILKIIAAIAKEITHYKDISEATTYTLKDVNVDFIGTLERNTRLFHSLRGIFVWMQSYFEACSDSLKPCIFLYVCLSCKTQHQKEAFAKALDCGRLL